MMITVNGKETWVNAPSTLSGIIEGKGLTPERIVVEYNGEIMTPGRFGEVAIKAGDRIEIVSFVGGG
jgi:sulfur carrier protein